MKRCELVGFLALALGVGTLFLWARIHSGKKVDGGTLPTELQPSRTFQGGPTHVVTPEMAEASREMVEHEAPRFTREATDGKTYNLAELLQRGPVVLTFTKVGCPCSEAAQPYFNQLALAYPGATLLGVVNAEDGPAQLWSRRIRAAYPQILDPDLGIVRDYGVENSAYVIVIDASGRMTEHWPGISQDMLGRLSARLTSLTNMPVARLDFTEAPDDLYTGCPYELESTDSITP